MRACHCLLGVLAAVPPAGAAEPPAKLAPFFKPSAEFADDYGAYRSPLKFDDGRPLAIDQSYASAPACYAAVGAGSGRHGTASRIMAQHRTNRIRTRATVAGCRWWKWYSS